MSQIVSIPEHGEILTKDGRASPSLQIFLDELVLSLNQNLLGGGGVRLPEYTIATLPNATKFKGGMIYVSNEIGGAVPAFSDGGDWRRVTDRAIVS